MHFHHLSQAQQKAKVYHFHTVLSQAVVQGRAAKRDHPSYPTRSQAVQPVREESMSPVQEVPRWELAPVQEVPRSQVPPR